MFPYPTCLGPPLLCLVSAIGNKGRNSAHYLKRNAGAGARIKQKFTEITGRQPYDARTGHNWDVQLVKYIRELSVAALIRDMEEVGKKAGSLVYFMYSRHGTPRWEKMVLDQVNQKLKVQKEDDNSAYAAMAKHFEMPLSKMDPSWVVEARRRYNELHNWLAYTFEKNAKEDIKREMTRIENNLVRRGYQL